MLFRSVGYTGFVNCYDGRTFQRQYQTSGDGSAAVGGIQVADVNMDGALELVITAGSYLYLHNARTGARIWQSVRLGLRGGLLAFLRVGNIDADPALEIVVGEEGGQIVIYDGQTRLQQLATASREITALELADLNGDGVQEVLVGATNGALYVLNPATGGVLQGLGNYGGRIDGLQVADLLGTPDPDMVFCVNGTLHIRYIDANTRQPAVWRSTTLGQNAGQSDSLRIADLDNDGRPEIILNVGIGLRVFNLVFNFPTGDVDRNGCVDDADLLLLLCQFGESGSNIPADLNQDGHVDDADLLIVLFNFGAGC